MSFAIVILVSGTVLVRHKKDLDTHMGGYTVEINMSWTFDVFM